MISGDWSSDVCSSDLVGRYLLRQDAQGSLTTYVPLPELIRAESLDVVSVGLPQPKVEAPAN